MLARDYVEMLQCFDRCGVEYLVVGAYALAAHGLPRSTGDIDLWIRPDPINARRVVTALAEFGAPMHDATAETFATPGMVFQIGVAPCRIDLITSLSGGIDFDQARQSQVICQFGEVALPVLSIRDLIANKRASGRPKDLEDVRILLRHHP